MATAVQDAHTHYTLTLLPARVSVNVCTQVWLGIGDALQGAIAGGHLPLLQQMYDEWPFFRGMLDLVEMVMAKVRGGGGGLLCVAPMWVVA